MHARELIFSFQRPKYRNVLEQSWGKKRMLSIAQERVGKEIKEELESLNDFVRQSHTIPAPGSKLYI